jgi:hypothetical protein
MTLSEIKNLCDTKKIGELSADVLNSPRAGQFFSLLGTPAITLKNPKSDLSADEKKLTVTAAITWRELSVAAGSFTCFLDERGTMQFALNAALGPVSLPGLLEGFSVSANADLPAFDFPAMKIQVDTQKNLGIFSCEEHLSNSWAVFGIPGLSLDKVSFALSFQHFGIKQHASLTLEIGGDLRVGQSMIRARTILPLQGDFPAKVYKLTLKTLTPVNRTLDDLGVFLSGVSPSAILPASFSNVPAVYLTELTAELDTAQKKISRSSIQLDIQKPWKLADGLSELAQATLKLTIDPVKGNFLDISALIKAGALSAKIAIAAGSPDSTWKVSLASAIKLPALKDMEALSPALGMGSWLLPESLVSQPVKVNLKELVFDFNPAQKSVQAFRFQADVRQLWELLPGFKIGNTSIWLEREEEGGFSGGISAEVAIGKNITLYLGGERTPEGFELEGELKTVDPVPLNDLVSKILPGFDLPASLSDFGIKGGTIRIGTAAREINFEMEGTYRKADFGLGFTYSAINGLKIHIANISMEMAASLLLNIPYPGDLPNPVIKLFELTVSKDGKIDTRLNVTEAKGLSEGGSHVQVSQVDFEYHRGENGTVITSNAKLSFRASAQIADILEIPKFSLDFKWASAGDKAKAADWELRQAMEGSLFSCPVKLAAEYTGRETEKSIKLRLEGDMPEIVLPGIFTYKLLSAELAVKKAGKDAPADIHLTATGSLTTPLFTFKELKTGFYRLGEKNGIELTAGSADIHILGDGYPWFSLNAPTLKLAYDGAVKSWSCEGEARFMAKEIPDTLLHILPADEVKAGFIMNKEKAEISIRTKELRCIPLPPHVPGLEMKEIAGIGDLYLGLSAFKADIKNVRFTASVVIGLPKNLNRVFKTGKDTQLDLFKVYDPIGDKETFGFSLSISKDGLGFQLDESPFKKIGTIIKIKERPAIDLDFGDCGRIQVLLPNFSLKSDGSLKAGGGFHIAKELSLPLLPLTFLLQQVGMEGLSKVLKPKIPLKGISFVDTVKAGTGEHKVFRLEKFFDLFTDPRSMPIPASIKETFKTINESLSRLPDTFLDYGDITIPDDLYFQLELTPAGSFKGELTVVDPEHPEAAVKPLKMLLPQFPVFAGIRLKSLAVGELFSGSLFRIDVDAVIDIFDVPTLAAALLIDPELPAVKTFLPDIKSLQRQVTLKNLTTLVIYQTGIPIPVPLFYDKLGFSALGLDGTEIVSSFEFPMPSLGLGTLKDFALLSSQLVGFFRDGKPLEIEKLRTINLGHFTVGSNYIRLPKYVAKEKNEPGEPVTGQLIGTENGFTLDTAAIIFAVADAVMKGSVNALIRSVELQKRVVEVEILLFDRLELRTQYAFTTPFEFQEEAYKIIQIPPDDRSAYLKLLPAPRDYDMHPGAIRKQGALTPETEGLIIFLSSSLRLQNILNFKAGFAFAAMEEGIGIGGRFIGTIAGAAPGANLLDIDLQGVIRVSPKNGAQLEGAGHLTLLGQNLVKGDFYYDRENLRLNGTTGEKGMPFYAKGNLTGQLTKDMFLLEGKTEIAILGFNASGRLLIDIRETAKVFLLEGNMNIGPLAHLMTSVCLASDEQGAYMAMIFDGYLGPLDLKLNGALKVERGSVSARGSLVFSFAGEPVLSCEFNDEEQVLVFSGKLDLFPKISKELLEIGGEVSGVLSPDVYRLRGDVRFRVAGFTLPGGKFLLDNEQALLSARFFDLQLQLRMERSEGMLHGSMQAIHMGTALVISSATPPEASDPRDLGGPAVVLTSEPAKLAFTGKAQLMGITATLEDMTIADGLFKMNASGNAFGLVKTDFRLSWISLRAGTTVEVSGDVHLEMIADELAAYITGAARQIRESLDQAIRDVETARLNVQKAAEAIEADVHLRVAEFKKQLDGQLVFLAERQAEADRLSGLINRCYEEIGSLKQQIADKKRWYDESSIIQKAYRWIELAAVVSEKGLEITRNYVIAGTLEALHYTTTGLLEAAKELVRGLEALITEAEKAIDTGLELFQHAADEALQNAQSAMVMVANTVGIFEQWSTQVLAASKALLEIESAQFSAYLSTAAAGEVLLEVKLRFLGEAREIAVGYTLFSKEHSYSAITNTLKARIPRPDEIALASRMRSEDVLLAAHQVMGHYPDVTPAQLSVALLRAGYDRRSEVQKIALNEIFVKTGKADVPEIAAAVMIGQRFQESYEKIR